MNNNLLHIYFLICTIAGAGEIILSTAMYIRCLTHKNARYKNLYIGGTLLGLFALVLFMGLYVNGPTAWDSILQSQ